MTVYESMRRFEFLAHVHAFTKEGTFYWDNFTILEHTYNSSHKEPYKRRW